MTNVVAAVDCGATSVRVCRVDLDAPGLHPEVVHRVAHAPRRDADGHLRWDWERIVGAVVDGLERALDHGPLASIGVDTWAVDYGLLGDDGRLLSDPYSYRDHRTDDYRRIADEFGAEAMYTINGLQLQPFNTVFQLAVHDADEVARAKRLLWLPELLVHHLTGVAVTERTSAGSSGLVDLTTGEWSPDLVSLARIDPGLLGDITTAGHIVGEWRGIPVALVGGHDTASAVAGMGARAEGGSAFVASGTWMLAGIERPEPDTSEWARVRNYTNEAGALGGVRFLRNVTGFWLLEQCRPAWGDPDVELLVAATERVGPDVPIVDVDDDRLRAPADMLGEYTSLAGLPRDADPALITRSVVESIVARTAEVIAELADRTTFDDVVLFGGAARMALLARRLSDVTGRHVRVGSAEAAAVGNAIVQGVALGTFTSIDDGRARLGAANPGGHIQ
ncbi:MAG TPA: FGGY-family carbohydrate kinase [Ilumatobacter sp.]|nr:FGGY-family carbohydrate kinase [Ilumatobacter sp.]